jgi:lysophospholipase L1-like esterase
MMQSRRPGANVALWIFLSVYVAPEIAASATVATVATVATAEPAAAQSMAAKPQALHMAALGDSITRAFNANTPIDHPQNSWSTGNTAKGLFRRGSVLSHAEYLSMASGRDVIVHNVARTGAETTDLQRQVKELDGVSLDYATILIGANDLCINGKGALGQSPDMSHYAERVEQAVTDLIQRNPNIRILLVSIPDMLRLQSIGHETACQSRWSTIGICQNLLHENISPSDLDNFGAQWRTANDDLRLIAQRHRENVMYSSVLSEFPFERQHLSDLDCFHPNIIGQNLLSKETWTTGWWGIAK